MQEIDKELILKAGKGDPKAFGEIYQKTCGYVYTLAFRITNRKQDAEEVTQDVFLRLHRALPGFQFRSAFKTWLYRIAVNTALNMARKKSRLAERETGYDDKYLAENKLSPERDLEAKEAEMLLRAFLEKLQPDHRACIILREIEGFDYQKISEHLGININTVRSRLKRAREALLALREKEVVSREVF